MKNMTLGAAVFWCAFFSCCWAADSSPVPRVELGNEKYLAAERATTPEERQQLFNEALAIYLSYSKENPSGMLLNNIGSVYFYLGDFGTAIGYFRRAEVQMPRDAVILKNLHVALLRADVINLQQERPLVDALGGRWCSPLERSGLSLGAIAITLVFFSLNLWLPSFGFLWLWRIIAMLTIALLMSQAWYGLVVSPQAVVVSAAPLRASSENVFSEPSVTTVRPGEVVEVQGTDESRHWVRVKTASHTTGYLPGQDLCFIE